MSNASKKSIPAMQSTGRSSTMVDSRTLVLSPIVNGRLTRPATGKGSPEALVRVKFEGSIFVLLNLQIGDVLSDSKVFWLPLSKLSGRKARYSGRVGCQSKP